MRRSGKSTASPDLAMAPQTLWRKDMHNILRGLLIPTTGLALALVAGCDSDNDGKYSSGTGNGPGAGGGSYGGERPKSVNITKATLEKSGAGLSTLGQS